MIAFDSFKYDVGTLYFLYDLYVSKWCNVLVYVCVFYNVFSKSIVVVKVINVKAIFDTKAFDDSCFEIIWIYVCDKFVFVMVI